jgi:hypothetical protein
MSGGSSRSREMKRSNSMAMREGSTSVIAKGIAHRRVGGRAPTLAEDALAACEGDDVVDGQEVVLVVELGDEGQFMFDEAPHLVRHAGREALCEAGLGHGPQVGGPG